MSRLVGLRFSQLRLLSANARQIRPSAVESGSQGETESQGSRDSKSESSVYSSPTWSTLPLGLTVTYRPFAAPRASERVPPLVNVSSTARVSGGSNSRPISQSVSLHDSLYINSLLDAFLALGMVGSVVDHMKYYIIY